MRTLIWVLIVVGIFLGLSFWSASYLDKTAAKMSAMVNKVEHQVVAKQWQKAGQSISQTDAQWQKTKDWWAIMIDHQEIDNIENALARLNNLTKGKDVPAALAETASLKKMLTHIPEKEVVNLHNIL